MSSHALIIHICSVFCIFFFRRSAWKQRPKWKLWKRSELELCDVVWWWLMWTGCYPSWAFSFFFFFRFVSFFVESFSFFLDLVRPFLDLVRCHAGSVVFVCCFGQSSVWELSHVELGQRFSLLPPNSSSPSLSIPPELFHNYLMKLIIWSPP